MAENSEWDNFKEAVSNFVDSITGGSSSNRSSSNREDGQEKASPGGYSTRAPTQSLRPQLRPGSTSTGNSSNGGDDSGKSAAERKAAADFAKRVVAANNNPAGTLSSVTLPHQVRRTNDPTDSLNRLAGKTIDVSGNSNTLAQKLKNLPRNAYEDFRLGLGSMTGKYKDAAGYAQAMEALGYGPQDIYGFGGIYDDIEFSQDLLDSYANYKDLSKETSLLNEKREAERDEDSVMAGGMSDPCPPGYRTDYVTNMCVPIQSAPMAASGSGLAVAPPPVSAPFTAPFTAPNPSLYTPFAPMQYTQSQGYSIPTITPPAPEGIAGIPTMPIMRYPYS